MSTRRFLPSTTGKLEDPTHERVRKNLDDRITELQKAWRDLATDIESFDSGSGSSGVPSGTGLVRVNGGAYAARAELSGDVSTSGSLVTAIGTNKVTDAQLRQSAGLSVVGRAANTTGNVADIVATTDGYVLQRSGTSVLFAPPPGLTMIGLGFFGDASDGSVNFDGTSTVLGAVPSTQTAYGTIGSVQRYIFTRDLHFDNAIFAAGVLLLTNCRVYVRGTLIGPSSGTAYIGNPGVNGAVGNPGSPSAGGAANTVGVLAAQVAGGGGAGGAGSGAAVGGSVATACPPGYVNTGGAGGAIGGNGTAGGAGKGGGGGGGSNGVGGAGGTVTTVADSEGSLSNLIQAVQGKQNFATTRYTGGSGGGGGGGTTSGNGGGGGGGGGGGNAIICARETTNATNVVALTAGGSGGGAYPGAVTAGQKCGPGGGAGGGWSVVVIGTGSFLSAVYNGGAAGAANSTALVTAGAGGDGYTRMFRVGA